MKLTDAEQRVISLKEATRTNPSPSEKLGTVWVAPGEGSTWRELFAVFGVYGGRCIPKGCGYLRNLRITPTVRTNLKLTGAPIQPTDRERWLSGQVK